MKAPDPTTIDNRYRGNRMPGILETPEMMGGTYGITNTLDLGGEPKIQDYLGGIGTSTTGPGGSTLYTGGGSMPGPIAARPPGFVDRPGGPIIGQMGPDPSAQPYNPVTGYVGNNMAGPINPETGGLYDLQNPFDPSAMPSAMPTDNFADNTDFFNNMHGFKPGFSTADYDHIQNVNPGGQAITNPGQVINQQPTGGFDSKVFANELLTGIGDLFKQHFPESAQMAFNNSNQPQSQIEQPIQDATTFDVQPQQNTAYNPFSVNTIGGAFGGGY